MTTTRQKAQEAKENEAAILSELEKEQEMGLDPTHPDNFNIVPGKPLPEGFENPPCGEEGHFCLDTAGCYQPDWMQLYLERVYDKQIDPQVFPLSSTWLVYLETWVDVPPEVIESLRSAVETVHRTNVRPGVIPIGAPDGEIEMKSHTRRRFHWRSYPSAKVSS